MQQETTPARVETPPRIPATATPTATLAPTLQPTATPSGTDTEGGEGEASGQTGTTDAAEQQTPQPTETPAPEPTATPTPVPEIVEIEGVITAMSQSVLEVDGRKIVLDANVVPDPVVLGKPGVGVHVRIRGIPTADGMIVLVELQTLPDKATQTPSPTPTPSQTPTPEPSPTAAPEPDETATPKPEFEISGSITAITDSSIEVGGRTIDIAKLLDTGAVSLESLEVGTMVQVIGYVRPGNVLAAVSLIIQDPETESGGSETETTPTPDASETPTPTVTPPADETQVTIEGVLTAVSEGAVEIDGQTVTIILEGEDATVVEGLIEVGATAVVIASPGEDGALVATSIVIQSGTATPDATPTPDNGDDGQN